MTCRQWLLLGTASLALGNVGCLLVAAGAGAGAAAAGYAYVKGRFYRDYPASPDDAFNAVHTALLELHFPLLAEKRGTDGTSHLESKTADGTGVAIDLEAIASRIPAEGKVTRVNIRVGALGDEAVSARILDQTELHLAPPDKVQPAPAPFRPATWTPAAATKEPPLSAAEPKR